MTGRLCIEAESKVHSVQALPLILHWRALTTLLLVTSMTVSVAAVDSTTTWWMYKRVSERPRLWQSDQPASLYLFCGFRP